MNVMVNPVIPVKSDELTPAQALVIVQARLLGATHRRISELFLGTLKQQPGASLITAAEQRLSLPVGTSDLDELAEMTKQLMDELGFVESSL